MFDKRSVERLHKPKRKDQITELLKVGLGHLQCYRHPRLLQILHGPDDSPEALAFVWDVLFFGRAFSGIQIAGATLALAAIYLASQGGVARGRVPVDAPTDTADDSGEDGEGPGDHGER